MKWQIKLTQKNREFVIDVVAEESRGAVLNALSIYRDARVIAIKKDGESFVDFHSSMVRSIRYPTRFENKAIDVSLEGMTLNA